MRFLPLCIHLLVVMPALAGDPHAPQLNVSFLAQPAPITQNGSMRLAYEMLITNFSKRSYSVVAIEAKAGEAHHASTFACLRRKPCRRRTAVARPMDRRRLVE